MKTKYSLYFYFYLMYIFRLSFGGNFFMSLYIIRVSLPQA